MATIKVDSILPNPDQPRTIFDEDELLELKQSIGEIGLVQPIVVERENNHHILIDGERRWRAVKLLGWKEISAFVRPSKGKENRLIDALVANVQRSDMGYIDEAKAYSRLLDELGSVEEICKKVGKSNATIYLRLNLLELDEQVQEFYNKKKLPLDLSIIAGLKNLYPAEQREVALNAITRGWKTTTILRVISRVRKRAIVKRTKEPVMKRDKNFNALAFTEKKIPEKIETAIRKTCNRCPMFNEASESICRCCPLPDFLRLLEADS